MNISDILRLKYPNIKFFVDYTIQDDGQGAYIAQWNLDVPKPTQEDLDKWETELTPQYQSEQNKIANKPIYEELKNIDLKSIRALRTNDVERLSKLEEEAIEFRKKLIKG